MAETKKVLIKHKRIVLYFNELSRYKISIDTALRFMSYIFNVSEVYILDIVRGRKSELKKLKDVRLEYYDMDIACIETFATHLLKNSLKERRK